MSGQCRSAAEAEKGEEILRLGALVGQDLDGRLGAIRSGGAGSGSGSSCRRCFPADGRPRLVGSGLTGLSASTSSPLREM